MTQSSAPASKADAMSQPFAVMMHPTLVDALDEGFSPMDGIVAIDQMFAEFPLLHQALAPKRLRKRAARTLKVYHGCYHWYKNLGFSYVQIGTTLHVLDLWYDDNPNLTEMDVILGTGRTEGYKPFETDQPSEEEEVDPSDSPFGANSDHGEVKARAISARAFRPRGKSPGPFAPGHGVRGVHVSEFRTHASAGVRLHYLAPAARPLGLAARGLPEP